jgi:diguanylate cyclase (GGDEF)-like protein
MMIDAFTVLLSGLLVKIVLGTLFLLLRLRTRRAHWFAWWSVTFYMSAVASLCFLAGGLWFPIAVALLIGSLTCGWQGARAFEKRPPVLTALFGLPAVWLGACLVPGFMESVANRVFVSSSLVAAILGLCAYEFWRGRAERLPSRWTVIALFTSLATIFAIRIPLIPVAPFPFGAQPAEPAYIAAFNLLLFFHTLVLAVLLVAMSKEREELTQRTKAQTDSLTGALNRRAFMSRGSRIVQRHQKRRDPLCLVFLDLDRFKALNDLHGHSGGDDVLTGFVNIVHNNIRPTDFLFRIGGEEFCCLLPFTRAQEARAVAERVRRAVEGAYVEVEQVPVKVTVSIGIAATEDFGYEVDTLVRRADMAVYSAKRAGRNRVIMATPNDSAGLDWPIPFVSEKPRLTAAT